MMNAGKKRPLLLLVALAMLLCGAMALGGTLAGGVNRENSTATNVTNNSDNMDYGVDILYADSIDGTYYNLLSGNPFANTLWCPGYTKIVYLKVNNREEIPVECTLDLIITESGFGNTLKYAVLSPNTDGTLSKYSNWTDFLAACGKKNDVLNKINSQYNIFDKVLLQAGTNTVYALAINMSQDANNDYKNANMKIDFIFRVDSDYEPNATPNN